MSNILIEGGTVLTPDGDSPVLYGADVAVADGAVLAVGAPPAGSTADEVVDARQRIVMPGLYNAHMHSGTVLQRGVEPYAGPDPWFDLRATQDGQIQRDLS
jgi:cytosine/adenosine deaminase-related metal-dependent hydrolase